MGKPMWGRYNEPAEVKRSERLSSRPATDSPERSLAGYRCTRCGILTTDRYGEGGKCPMTPDDLGLRDYHTLEPIRLVAAS